MKVAELYAELGIKFEDQRVLDGLASTLSAAAESAKSLALSLKQIAAVRMLREPRVSVPSSAAPARTRLPRELSGPGWSVVPGNPSFIGPLPSAPEPPGVQAGLKSLATLGLKVGGIATLALAVKKLVHSLTEWMRASMAAAVGTTLFTRRTGQTQQSLKQWELASRQAGLSQDEAAQNIESMTRKQSETKWLGGNMTPFNILGISPMSTPTEIFKAFQKRTQGLAPNDVTFIGEQVGFSKDWAAFLHNFKGELPDLKNVLPTQEQLNEITKLNAAWETLSFTMRELGQRILGELSPALRGLIYIITGILRPKTHAESVGYAAAGWQGLGGMMPSAYKVNTGSTSTVINAPVTISGVSDPKEAKRLFEQSNTRNAEYFRTLVQRPPPMVPASP